MSDPTHNTALATTLKNNFVEKLARPWVLFFFGVFLVAIVAVKMPLQIIALCFTLIALFLFMKNTTFGLVSYLLLFPFGPYLASKSIPALSAPKGLFLLFAGAFALKVLQKKQTLNLRQEPVRFALVWFCIAALSVFGAAKYSQSLIALISLGGMMALMILIANITIEKKHFRLVLVVLLIQCAVFSIFAALQFFTGKTIGNIGYYPDARYFITYRSYVRASAVFLHPNDFSSYLLIMIPTAFGAGIAVKNGWAKIGAFITAILGTMAIVLTFTRSAWLALIGGIFLVLAKNYIRQLIVLALVIAIVLAALAMAFPEQTQIIASRFDPTMDRSISDRFWAYSAAVQMFAEHPILGVGVGQYEINYPDYKPPEAGWTAKGERVPMTVHNAFLEVISELGVLGAVVFLLFVLSMIKLFFELRRCDNPQISALGTGIFAGLTAFFIQAQFNNQIYMEILWIALGLGLGLHLMIKKNESEQKI